MPREVSWPRARPPSLSPVARPAAASVVGPPRQIGSEPWFPSEEEPVLARFWLIPTAPLDEQEQPGSTAPLLGCSTAQGRHDPGGLRRTTAASGRPLLKEALVSAPSPLVLVQTASLDRDHHSVLGACFAGQPALSVVAAWIRADDCFGWPSGTFAAASFEAAGLLRTGSVFGGDLGSRRIGNTGMGASQS